MLFPTPLAVAAAALATQAMAETGSKPKLFFARMSASDVFGLQARDDDSGYQPTESFCGSGESCAEACGQGYAQCTSDDNQIHCYHTSNQTCCAGTTGDSCDNGYYCAADGSGSVWCCPDGQSLADCASNYQISGSLTSDDPVTATPTPTAAVASAASATDTAATAPSSTTSIDPSLTCCPSPSSLASSVVEMSSSSLQTVLSLSLTSTPANSASQGAPTGTESFSSDSSPSAGATNSTEKSAANIQAPGALLVFLSGVLVAPVLL